MKVAAMYTRVSSERQKEAQTIESQVVTLKEFATKNGYSIPEEWIFRDNGYSGASLIRPGLEALRDIIAGGEIEAVFVHSPDRLSRKYSYQVLLLEEFSGEGVEVKFKNSPQANTPEEQLLVQFQGMIAEYERAQIMERSRRGKRHKARCGIVNVLGGAPYGYNYIKKTELQPAYYEINPKESSIVCKVYDLYTKEWQSMGSMTKWLNSHQVPTRKGISPWERSTVWAMLRNRAYIGRACFGKTKQGKRKIFNRLSRKKGIYSVDANTAIDAPRNEWIEIPVPALIDIDTFEIAQNRLKENIRFAARRTREPSLLQGMLVCHKCGYAYYRTATRTSKHKIYYYRCLGSDNYRYQNGRICESKPIRQDYLDNLIWDQILHLLENPTLIKNEIEKRIEKSRNTSVSRKRKTLLEKEIVRVQNGTKNLIDAYQESLLSIQELRKRIPELKKREKVIQKELHSLEMAEAQEEMYFRIMRNMNVFLKDMIDKSNTLTVIDKQKILRSIVKEIYIDKETIQIIHSIPEKGNLKKKLFKNKTEEKNYLLCLGSNDPTLRSTFTSWKGNSFLDISCFQPLI